MLELTEHIAKTNINWSKNRSTLGHRLDNLLGNLEKVSSLDTRLQILVFLYFNFLIEWLTQWNYEHSLTIEVKQLYCIHFRCLALVWEKSTWMFARRMKSKGTIITTNRIYGLHLFTDNLGRDGNQAPTRQATGLPLSNNLALNPLHKQRNRWGYMWEIRAYGTVWPVALDPVIELSMSW